jgi:hypothetical protein
MLSATLEYPILLANNTISTIGDSSTFKVGHIQAVGQPSDYFDFHDPNSMSFTTLGGVAVAAQNMFTSQAIQNVISISISGSLASQYIDYGAGPTQFFINQDACAMNW